MAQNFREPQILALARQDGKVTVDDLAKRLEVTVQTIRRDLAELSEAGKLDRVHGGAVLPSSVSNIGYEDRRGLHGTAKTDIARRCAEAIPAGSSLFLNIGTSTEAVAAELLQHRDLLVVTNNINVARILLANPDCRIVLAGGELRRSDAGLTGDLTIQAIRQFKVDFAVIGCSALDLSGDLLDFDISEVGVSKEIIRCARQVFLVADHSKFQRSAPVRIASLEDMSTLFTDVPLPAELAERCRAWNTSVVTTGGTSD